MPTVFRARLLVLLSLAAGCGQPNQYVEPPPPEVVVVHPLQRTVTEYLEFTGVTQPVETVEIRARVKGFLKERHFTEGAEVKKGQLLLVIDEEPFKIQLEAAETKAKEAAAVLQQATESKSREVARAQVALSEAQLQLSRQEEQRIKSLLTSRASSKADFDEITATRAQREAELESAKAHLDQANSTYDTAILTYRAQLASAQIAVRNAKLDLSYCRMFAPIDGRISRIHVDVENLVGDGESTVLATIMKMDPVYAYATISEADAMQTPSLIRAGTEQNRSESATPVSLGIASADGYPYSGHIDYCDPNIDAGTGTLRIRGVFNNSDRSLLPGMFVRLRTPVGQRPDALLVPERALGTDQSGRYLLVVDADGVVQHCSVKTGVLIDDLRIVEGKIGPKDSVIVDGLLRARPGAKVTPKEDQTPTASLATAGRL